MLFKLKPVLLRIDRRAVRHNAGVDQVAGREVLRAGGRGRGPEGRPALINRAPLRGDQATKHLHLFFSSKLLAKLFSLQTNK